ncbi:mannose-6-phosphate isomerase [Bacteroides pyogenes JCM 10003]|nr:mannose-6-phosphate isomerase [Bacteroides pyogenes JCM 10003]
MAREAINYEVLDDYRTKYEMMQNEPVELVACPYFTTSVYDMTEEIGCDYSELDSFVIFICVEGSCRIKDNENNELTLDAGETVLLPATTQDITIAPGAKGVKLLETYV